MTISTTTSVVTYQGNNSTTVFTFSFIADSTSYISVYLTNSLGVRTGPLASNQYGITLNSPPVGGLWGIGGTVTYPLVGSPLAPGNFISIVRDVPYEQNVSINNQGAFYPQAVEQALDVLELQIQQIETAQQYSFQAPVTDVTPPNVLPPAALRANGTFMFDANGQPVIGFPSTGGGGSAGSSTPRKVSTTGTATINVLTTDSGGGVSIYQSSSPVTTIQLPATLGPYPVFDASGNAGTSPITILPPAGKTINGLSSYIMAFNYQSAEFYLDGTSVVVL